MMNVRVTMINMRAWSTAFVFGCIGILLSAFLFDYIAFKTGYILGLVTILCGMLSGIAVGLGYKISHGFLATKRQVSVFEHTLLFFGLGGMLVAYFGPYLFFDLDFSTYLSLIDFNLKDIVFILVGAVGAWYTARFFIPSLVSAELYHQLLLEKRKEHGAK